MATFVTEPGEIVTLLKPPPGPGGNGSCVETTLRDVHDDQILKCCGGETGNRDVSFIPGNEPGSQLSASNPGSKICGSLRRLTNDATFYLYGAKFLQCLGDRTWIYSGPLLLLSLRPDTLTLPALYGFITGISVILFGPVFGEWVDRKPRMYAATVTTVLQNGFLGLASLLLGMAILLRNSMDEYALMLCVASLIIVSFVANIFYATSLVIIEKDWVAVIAGNDNTKLACMIATVRRIELLVQIFCPLVMAQLLTYAGNGATATIIGIWSLLTIGAEYLFLRHAWQLAPGMKEKSSASLKDLGESGRTLSRKVFKTCFSISNGWTVFWKNKVGSAAFAVTLLEANVIVFNGVTCGYAVTQDFSNTAVSLLVAGDALAGVLSTFVFPFMRRKLALEKIGLSAMCLLLLSHAVCVCSNWMPGSPFDPEVLWHGSSALGDLVPIFNETDFYNLQLALAVMGVQDADETETYVSDLILHPLTAMIVFSAFLTVGRFAYGVMELTGSQLLLENTTEEDRGAVCSVQYSFKQIFVRLTYLGAILLPWPQTFGILIILSFCCTAISFLLFFNFVRKRTVRPEYSL